VEEVKRGLNGSRGLIFKPVKDLKLCKQIDLGMRSYLEKIYYREG